MKNKPVTYRKSQNNGSQSVLNLYGENNTVHFFEDSYKYAGEHERKADINQIPIEPRKNFKTINKRDTNNKNKKIKKKNNRKKNNNYSETKLEIQIFKISHDTTGYEMLFIALVHIYASLILIIHHLFNIILHKLF